jgi:CMP-N-acetylneuraminic acid synthetase
MNVVGVSNILHGDWMFQIEEGYLMRLDPQERIKKSRLLFKPNGLLYLISPRELRKEKSFFSDRCIPLVNYDDYEDIDIDTQRDFFLAETLKGKISQEQNYKHDH